VLITNFETLRTDLKFFLKVPWHCLVVDEAQRIKGVDSIVRSDMMRIPREHVVLLTGTPIQNSMEELWSLLNFLDPSNFDSLAKFMESHGVVHTPEQVLVDLTMLSCFTVLKLFSR
jgi:chromodomain-helicase-DNA-binding protein 6